MAFPDFVGVQASADGMAVSVIFAVADPLFTVKKSVGNWLAFSRNDRKASAEPGPALVEIVWTGTLAVQLFAASSVMVVLTGL
jgi:hypothetical protein